MGTLSSLTTASDALRVRGLGFRVRGLGFRVCFRGPNNQPQDLAAAYRDVSPEGARGNFSGQQDAAAADAGAAGARVNALGDHD